MSDYYDLKLINSGLVRECVKSPVHGYLYLTQKKEATASMRFGTLFHLCILEPEKFDAMLEREDILVLPDDKIATKALKDKHEYVIKQKDLVTLSGMRESLIASYPQYINDAANKFEYEIITDKYKAKIDILNPKLIIDLKTTSSADYHKFTYDIKKYRYDLQMKFYSHISQVNNSLIIACETEPPYMCQAYDTTDYNNLLGVELSNAIETASEVLEQVKSGKKLKKTIYREEIYPFFTQEIEASNSLEF